MSTASRTAVWLFFLAACIGLTACSSPGRTRETPARDPRSVPVFRGDSAQPATLDDVISAASSVDVVLIGENHGHNTGLATAAAIWQGVLDRSPNAALSMEFLERHEQAALDDYLAGLTTEDQFKKATGRSAGNYPSGHSAMVDAAKAKSRPVIAANSPRVYVRTARTDGFERLATLTETQRRLFRIPEVVPTGRYRTDFNEVMNNMTEPPTEMTEERTTQLDAMFRSQSVWDWTMADSIARALAAGNSPVLHVVGRFHTDFGGGTVQALRLIRPGVRILTISFVDASSDSLREADKDRADFVLYAGEQK